MCYHLRQLPSTGKTPCSPQLIFSSEGTRDTGKYFKVIPKAARKGRQVTVLTNLLISLFERHSLYVLDTAFSVPLIIGQVIKHKKQNKIFLKNYIQTPDYYSLFFFSIFVF